MRAILRGASRVAAGLGQRRRTARRMESRNHASHTLSPRPSGPTRFMPSFQSPVPISGRPCGPVSRLSATARTQCSYSDARSAGDRRTLVRLVLVRLEQPAFEKRHLLVEHGVDRRSQTRTAAPRRPATTDRRRTACARPVRPARATSAARRLRRTAATRRAADGSAPGAAPQTAAPARPATGRGSRTRRSIGRTPIVPRCGTPGLDTAASDSASGRATRSGVLTTIVPSRRSQNATTCCSASSTACGSRYFRTRSRAASASTASPSRPTSVRVSDGSEDDGTWMAPQGSMAGTGAIRQRRAPHGGGAGELPVPSEKLRPVAGDRLRLARVQIEERHAMGKLLAERIAREDASRSRGRGS